MSRMRHKMKKAEGGRTEMKVSGNPDVFKEAEERKKGGRAKRATGGQVSAPKKVIGLMTGGGVRPRLDRPGRKSGGRVGADKSPLSSAHDTTSARKDGETARGAPD